MTVKRPKVAVLDLLRRHWAPMKNALARQLAQMK
jgi:hypothetical protein